MCSRVFVCQCVCLCVCECVYVCVCGPRKPHPRPARIGQSRQQRVQCSEEALGKFLGTLLSDKPTRVRASGMELSAQPLGLVENAAFSGQHRLCVAACRKHIDAKVEDTRVENTALLSNRVSQTPAVSAVSMYNDEQPPRRVATRAHARCQAKQQCAVHLVEQALTTDDCSSCRHRPFNRWRRL